MSSVPSSFSIAAAFAKSCDFEIAWLKKWKPAARIPSLEIAAQREDDVAHLAHARVGEHALHVRLGQGEECADDDRHRADNEQDLAPRGRAAERRLGDAQEREDRPMLS